MKRRLLVAMAALTLTLSLSCALLAPGSSSLSFTIPRSLLRSSEPASKDAAVGTARAEGENLKYIRVYLEVSGALQPLGTRGVVFETAIPTDAKIEINDIPPMRDCTIYLALSEEGGTDFRAVKFAKSAKKFNVVAGGTTEVEVVSSQSPFRDIATKPDGNYLRDTVNGVRALELNGQLYFIADGVLYYKNANDEPATVNLKTVAGVTKAFGLAKGKVLEDDGSFGADRLWINTDKGIWTFHENESNEAVITQLVLPAAANSAAILDSGALTVAYSEDEIEETINVVYYQRQGGAGAGIFMDGEWSWNDSDEFIDALGPLTDIIKNSTTKIVADMHIEYDGTDNVRYGYAVVPGLNTLRIGADAKTTLEELDDDSSVADIISQLTGNNAVFISKNDNIRSLSKAGNRLYVGTNRGLYYIDLEGNEGKLPSGYSPKAISLGRTVDVVKVRSKKLEDDIWTAVLGKQGSLYIVKNGVLDAEYQFYTGIPEFGGAAATTGDLFWSEEGLVVTGTNGAVLYPLTAQSIPQ